MHVVGFLRSKPRLMVATVALVAMTVTGLIASPLSHARPLQQLGQEGLSDLELLFSAENAFIAPAQEEVTFTFEAKNASESPVEESTLEVYFSPTRVVSADDFDERLAAETLPDDVGVALAAQKLGDVGASDSRSVDVTIATTELAPLALQGDGVYLVYAVLEAGTDAAGQGEPRLAITPIVWRGTGTPTQTPLHTVVPLVLPASIDGMPTQSQLAELTSADGRLSANLDAAIQRGSTLAVDPRIVVATRAFGEDAPESATAFLTRLASAVNPKFSLQYADADLAAQAQLNLDAPLEPRGFSYLSGLAPNANLGAFDYSVPDVAWPRVNTMTEPALNFIAAAGFSTLFLDSRNLEPSAATSGTIGNTRVVSFDGMLQDAAAGALTGPTALARSASTSKLVAALALLNQSPQGTVPTNLGFDRGGAAARSVQSLLTTVSSLPWIAGSSINTVLAQQANFSLKPTPIAPERLEDLSRALGNEPKVAEYAAVLTRPRFLKELQRMRVLQYFGTALGPSTPGYTDATDAYFARDERTLNGVYVNATQNTNLLGTSSRVPVQISNDLPFTARIFGEVLASNTSLIIDESVIDRQSIEKKSSINVTIPVQTRVSAGSSSIIVRIYASNDLLVDEAVLPVTIRSSWESVALITLGVIIMLFFGFGIWRSVQRKRRQGFSKDLAASEN